MTPGPARMKYGAQRLRALTVYTGSYRGIPRADGVFLIYSDHNRDVIHLVPENYDTTPENLRRRCERPGRHIHAGGSLSTEECDFTMLIDTAVADIPVLILRWAATRRAWARRAFQRYLGAEILIDSRPSPFGTIRDVIARANTIIH